jgi:glutathione peroxidase
MNDSIFNFKVRNISNNEVSLEDFRGKTLLIVNTASKCGFTSQYTLLEELYKKYKNDGLEILAFPCNQFGKQEPGDNQEILSFCEINYSVTFPIFSKIHVNGPKADPLFTFLKNKLPGILGTKDIKWNFTKFLIDSDGLPIKRLAPKDSPEKFRKLIEKSLKIN